jgi:hypothetical protein
VKHLPKWKTALPTVHECDDNRLGGTISQAHLANEIRIADEAVGSRVEKNDHGSLV